MEVKHIAFMENKNNENSYYARRRAFERPEQFSLKPKKLSDPDKFDFPRTGYRGDNSEFFIKDKIVINNDVIKSSILKRIKKLFNKIIKR